MDQVQAHRAEIEVLSKYCPDAARILETSTDAYENAVMQTRPEWIDLTIVQEWTGRSDRWLRDWCQETETTGAARKKENGRWEIQYASALELPTKQTQAGEREASPYLDRLAMSLGGEA